MSEPPFPSIDSLGSAPGDLEMPLLAALTPASNGATTVQPGGQPGGSEESSTPPLLRFPEHGITMNGIRAFIASVGGRGALEGKTTKDVNKLVQRATAAKAESYCETLRSSPDSLSTPPSSSCWTFCHPSTACHSIADVGRPTVFVSHSWGYKFLDVVDALEAWAAKLPAGAPTPLFWFDLFTNSQHHSVERPFEWWDSVFREAVASIGHTVLVLSWDGAETASALTRVWCLVELVASLADCVKLEVVMPPRERGAFMKALVGDVDSVFGKLFKVDCEKARAFHGDECLGEDGGCSAVAKKEILVCPNDLARIREFVGGEKGMGFREFNLRVITHMVEWMVSVAREEADRLPKGSLKRVLLSDRVGRMLHGLGQLELAEPLLRDAVDVRGRRLGRLHARTINSMHNLACLLDDMDNSAEAHRLIVDAKKRSELAAASAAPRRFICCGATQHSQGATQMSDLNAARALLREGKFGDAESLYRSALAVRARVLGESHPFALKGNGVLAQILIEQDRYDEAEKVCRQAMDTCTRDWGEGHTRTVLSVGNLLYVLLARGDFQRLEDMISAGLDGYSHTTGQPRPAILVAFDNLGCRLEEEQDYCMKGRWREFHHQVVILSAKVLGEEHDITIECKIALAGALERNYDWTEAATIWRSVVTYQTRLLGSDHEDTLASMARLGSTLEKLQKRNRFSTE